MVCRLAFSNGGQYSSISQYVTDVKLLPIQSHCRQSDIDDEDKQRATTNR